MSTLSISAATIDLVACIIRPLVAAGALHKSEQQAVVRILKDHTPGKHLEEKPVVTVTEAARLLSVSNRSVLRMIASEELEAFRLRKNSPKSLRITRYSLDAVLHVINSKEVSA